MTGVIEPKSKPPRDTSLWTTPASGSLSPLEEATIDESVSTAKLRDALEAARARAAAFSGCVTDELLRKSF